MTPVSRVGVRCAHANPGSCDVINADQNQPSEIVEFTTTGHFVKALSVDPNLGGSFGLSTQIQGATSQFAAVDDNKSTLSIWTQNTK